MDVPGLGVPEAWVEVIAQRTLRAEVQQVVRPVPRFETHYVEKMGEVTASWSRRWEQQFGERLVEVSQTQADLLSRFFDHTFHDRPGGYGAAVSAASAARALELHAGRVSVERLHPIGCRVGVALPL